MENLVDDRVEKVAVVADHHEPAVMGTQEVTEPGDRVGVEMVRRLVQDERRCAGEKYPGQLHSAALATREGAERLGEDPVGEAQAGSDRSRFGLGGPSAEKVELLFEPGVTLEDSVLVLAFAITHVGTGGMHLPNDAIEAPRPEDAVPGDDGEVPGAGILGKVGDGLRAANRARGRQGLAREHPGEGGLAGTVAPDKADPVAGRDLKGHRLEELATSGGELKVGGSDHDGRFLSGQWR